MYSPHLHIEVISGRIERIVASERARLTLDGREIALPPGAQIFPGFTDTHLHLMGIGMMAERVNLRGARSAEECARRMAERATVLPPGTWVLGFGWNQEEWSDGAPFIRSLLDALLPSHPAVLKRVDSHALAANSVALASAGTLPHDIEGGAIVRDADGEPTGLLIDAAMTLVERAAPPPSERDRERWIAAGVAACHGVGLTAVHDMDIEPARLSAMIVLAERGELKLRTSLFLHAQSGWPHGSITAPQTLAPYLDAVGIKLYADGALGSRGAFLLDPYSDAPETCGISMLDIEAIIERSVPALEAGFGIATHAIGDGANRVVLDAYDRLRERFPAALLRVEHAQNLHPYDVPRFAALDVVAAVQAIHCTSDAAMADARLGAERAAERAYPWRALIESGAAMVGGSDAPIESPDPLLGLRAFVDRTPLGSDQPWTPAMRIGREDALAAYTSRASRGLPKRFRHERYFEPGAAADIAVVVGDPFADSEARTVLTLVDGEIVHDNRTGSASS